MQAPSIRNLFRSRWARIAAGLLLFSFFVAAAIRFVRAPKNLALHRPITASSTRYGDPAALVNGAIEWGTFAYHSDEDDPSWVVIDLGERASIREIRVFNRGDAALDDATGIEVDLSDDKATFRAGGNCRALFTQASPCELSLRNAKGRYVRVTGNRYLALSEIEVYGTR